MNSRGGCNSYRSRSTAYGQKNLKAAQSEAILLEFFFLASLGIEAIVLSTI